jgi:hypothetical protein
MNQILEGEATELLYADWKFISCASNQAETAYFISSFWIFSFSTDICSAVETGNHAWEMILLGSKVKLLGGQQNF